MPLFKLACPGCKHAFKIELPEGAERGKVTCPQCQTTFVVKAPRTPPPAPIDSPANPPAASVATAEWATQTSTPAAASSQPGTSATGSAFPSDDDIQTSSASAPTASSPAVPASLEPYAPPTAAVSVAPGHGCPLCGRTDRYYAVRGKMLYDQKVCRKCYGSFLNRRQAAFVIDIFIMYFLSLASGFVGGFIIGFLMATSQGEVSEAQLAAIEVLFNLVGFAIYALWFLFKDGFNGASPGKAMMGICVIDERTGEPIGFGGSAKRNWIIVLLGIVPFAWLIIGAMMGKGYRIGDQWAKTKVIWKKYKSSRVFAPNYAATFGSGLSASYHQVLS